MDEMKFKELMKNEEFIAKMLEAATIEEVKSLFSEKGIALTDEELNQMAKSLEVIVDNNGKIPDANLKNVVGGIASTNAAKIGTGVGFVAGSSVVSALIYGAYKLYRKGYKKGQEECLNVIKRSGLLNDKFKKFN